MILCHRACESERIGEGGGAEGQGQGEVYQGFVDVAGLLYASNNREARGRGNLHSHTTETLCIPQFRG